VEKEVICRRWGCATVAAGLAVICAGSASASEAAADAPRAVPGQLVEWSIPAATTVTPLSEAEKERGRSQGRALPVPELLQPALDAQIPSYQPRKDLRLSGSFTAAASDVLPSLVELWLKRFREYYPDVSIQVKPPYAGSLGTIELVKEKLDFVFVSRELKPEDISSFSAKFGYGPLSVPISGGAWRHYGFLDAIAVIVHKDNPLERVSYEQLDAIFSSTRHRGGAAITNWGQLGLKGEWANKPVHSYGIKPWNGFEEFVRQRVLSTEDKRGEWNEAVRFDPVVFPLAARVAADPLAIGYTGLAYVDAGVRVLAVSTTAKGPALAPTYENVARADYPLSRLIFFNTNSAPGKPINPVIEELLRFILSREGQQLVLDHQIFLPLRNSQVVTSRDQLARWPAQR